MNEGGKWGPQGRFGGLGGQVRSIGGVRGIGLGLEWIKGQAESVGDWGGLRGKEESVGEGNGKASGACGGIREVSRNQEGLMRSGGLTGSVGGFGGTHPQDQGLFLAL